MEDYCEARKFYKSGGNMEECQIISKNTLQSHIIPPETHLFTAK